MIAALKPYPAMKGSGVPWPGEVPEHWDLPRLEKGNRYWFYIVENATSDEPRILEIQDPAGNARTFTFDEGWREIAMVSQVNVETGEVKV